MYSSGTKTNIHFCLDAITRQMLKHDEVSLSDAGMRGAWVLCITDIYVGTYNEDTLYVYM